MHYACRTRANTWVVSQRAELAALACETAAQELEKASVEMDKAAEVIPCHHVGLCKHLAKLSNLGGWITWGLLVNWVTK